MASPTSADLLDHEDPWTEEEFLALPWTTGGSSCSTGSW